MNRLPKLFLRNSALIVAFAAFLSCATSQAEHNPAAIAQAIAGNPARPPVNPADDISKTVLLISVDGLRPDYLSAQTSPTIWSLVEKGAMSEGLIPIFPSLTFPNHFTLVTGRYSETHGIVGNEIRDPNIPERFALNRREVVQDPRWWLAEPIWSTAQKNGLKSGTMFWPGSEVEILGMRPTYWHLFDSTMPRDTRVGHVLKWLDLPKVERPQFLTLYFEDVDSAGHKFGPSSPEVKTALLDVDTSIALLIKGLKERKLFDQMQIVLVSDHGMSAIVQEKRVFIGDVMKEFPAGQFETIGGGAVFGVFSKDTALQASIAKRLQNFSPLYKVYLKKDIPARFHYQNSNRVPDVLVIAEEGAYIQMSTSSHSSGGTHGYDNQLAVMRATFIGHGTRFKAGYKGPPVENIHVYSLLCDLLGIKAPSNDGNLSAFKNYLNK